MKKLYQLIEEHPAGKREIQKYGEVAFDYDRKLLSLVDEHGDSSGTVVFAAEPDWMNILLKSDYFELYLFYCLYQDGDGDWYEKFEEGHLQEVLPGRLNLEDIRICAVHGGVSREDVKHVMGELF